jgi:D-alanyl-D-alanine carboxypeptidase/D-alanyl-D-alanine-endopeptidase (penicillin-binding protein 4)
MPSFFKKSFKNEKCLFILFTFLMFLQSCTTSKPSSVLDIFTPEEQKILSHASLGVMIIPLHQLGPLYEQNAHQYFNPASTLKILTALAALSELEAFYQFETSLWAPSGSTTPQDVYLKVDHDPTFSTEDLISLFEKVKEKEITEIKGNIILSSPSPHLPAWLPGWMLDDIKYPYSSPLMPLILDKNITYVQLSPSSLNSPAYLEAESYPYTLQNLIITKPHTPEEGWNYKIEGRLLTFFGAIAPESPPETIPIPIHEPLMYLESKINEILKNLGISFKGKVMQGSLTNNMKKIATHFSKPLIEILIPAMKTSDNLVMDALFIKLASLKNPNVQTWKQAGHILKNIIKTHFHVDLSQSVWTDGSGLSRYNLFTPHQFAQLLSSVANHKKLFSEFLSTLPINGVDGTLINRISDPKSHGYFLAKTGSMSGISTLAGYGFNTHHDLYVMVIFFNNFSEPVSIFRNYTDRIYSDILNS